MTRLLCVCVTLVSACAGPASTANDSGLADDGDGKADGPGSSTGGLKSGTYAWSCKDGTNEVLKLTHKGKTIISETIAGYDVIENSAKRADSDIGLSVFDVKPSAITFLDIQELKLSLSLQDYSDIQSWLVYLQADPADQNGTYFGVLLSTFQSSDGDDLLHPYSVALKCTTTKS